MATTEVGSDGRAGSGPGARYALFLLFVANALNQADRALLGIVTDPVKADLHLSDTEMSVVSGTAFVLFNLIVGIFIARRVDHGNRKRILLVGVALWSAATALTGLASGFYSLALLRILVGVGEATAFPVAISMIADLFSPGRRPRAIGIFQSSTLVGIVTGSIAAGVLAAAHGWRAMFLICGAAGLVLVLVMLPSLREPTRGRFDETPRSEDGAGDLAQVLRTLLALPGFGLLALGTGVAGMTTSVLPVWAPAFLLRSHHVPLAKVGALIGPAVGLGGICGTLAAGALASRLTRRRGSEIYGLLVPLTGLPLAIPFYLLFCFAPSLAVAMISATVMNFLLASGAGPCIAAAVSMSPPRMRAVASTLVLTALGVVGGALAPLIVGAVSDALAPQLGAQSLRYALATMTIAPLLGSAILWSAYRRARP